MQSLQQLRATDPDLRREEGSVFEAAAVSFSLLVEELGGRIAAEVLANARTACKKYRGERSAVVTGT